MRQIAVCQHIISSVLHMMYYTSQWFSTSGSWPKNKL